MISANQIQSHTASGKREQQDPRAGLPLIKGIHYVLKERARKYYAFFSDGTFLMKNTTEVTDRGLYRS